LGFELGILRLDENLMAFCVHFVDEAIRVSGIF
jgi:hypothetical protein